MEILHFPRYEIWQANEIVRIQIILVVSMIFKFILTANEDVAVTLACQEYWQQYRVMNQQFLTLVNNYEKIVFNIFANPHKHQTWNLSKNLQDRRFQGKKFTQNTRNFRHLLNCNKKCVNALNWDKTSKKSLFYQFIWAQHQ